MIKKNTAKCVPLHFSLALLSRFKFSYDELSNDDESLKKHNKVPEKRLKELDNSHTCDVTFSYIK